MPIINFSFNRKDVPADAVNVQESTQRVGSDNREVPMYTWESHNGLCIKDYERNGYDDSDFVMIVWNAEKQEPEHYCFASTRGWSYPSYGSSADATPEVMEAYNAWSERIAQAARERKARADAARPDKGKMLRVARGRKVAVGTEGLCFWIGQSAYGMRVGLKTPTGRVFTAVSNVEVVASL